MIECNAQTPDISSVKIGKQIWMVKNLDVANFSNGVPIPEKKTIEEWKEADANHQPAWCNYENDSLKGFLYGKLYNFWAVTDSQHVCPNGWRVPRNSDWEKLVDRFGGDKQAGAALKNKWAWIENDGDNRSGFSSLPAGVRFENGKFDDQNKASYWWTADKVELIKLKEARTNKSRLFGEGLAWSRVIRSGQTTGKIIKDGKVQTLTLKINGSEVMKFSGAMGKGMSIRCIKD